MLVAAAKLEIFLEEKSELVRGLDLVLDLVPADLFAAAAVAAVQIHLE